MSDVRTQPDRLAALAWKGEEVARRRSDRPVRQARFAPPAWMPMRTLIASVSQLHHGELLTARICRTLERDMAIPEARHCLELQRKDEIAHADLYAGYLADLGGTVRPHQVFDLLETAVGGWTGAPEAVILAVHVLLEGEAAALQRGSDTWLPCPRFGAINRLVAQDEARHIAFGRIYLPQALAVLPQRERQAMYLWLHDLWWRAARQIYGASGLAGFTTAPGLPFWARRRWRFWQGELRGLGLYSTTEAPAFERT